MTLVNIPGDGLWTPRRFDTNSFPSFISVLIDATGEKIGQIGHVWWPDRAATKVCTGLGFNAGAIVSAGGSLLDISLQNVSLTTGPPGQPDGTKDQTDNIALSALTQNAWNSITFDGAATRTLAYHEQIAAVWEFDAGGRLGVDTFNLRGLDIPAAGLTPKGSFVADDIGGWGSVTTLWPNIVFIFNDGTFGTLLDSFVVADITTHLFNSGSAADEIAMQFSFPGPVAVDAIEIGMLTNATNADFNIVLYDGTTALQTVVQDYNTVGIASVKPFATPFPAAQSLSANTVYRVSVLPTTVNNITIYSFDVSIAAHLALHAGTAFHYWERVNAGAWSGENTVRCLFMHIRVSSIDDGAGGGGGGLHLVGAGGLAG